MAIYRHMRACSLIYARADMKAAGDREVSGMEGGSRGGRHPETQRAKSDPGRVCGVGPILHIRGRGTERAFLSWQGGIQSAIAPVPTGAPQNLTLTPKTA